MSVELSDLTMMIKHLQMLNHRKETWEKDLQQINRDIQRFEREVIPDIMADIGIKQLQIETGETVSIEEKVFANISEARSEEAIKWLEDNSLDAIVKKSILLQFGQGLAERVDLQVLENFLKESEIAYESKPRVHPATLKAFVKEQLAVNPDFPKTLFGVFVVEEVSLEKPKTKKQKSV